MFINSRSNVFKIMDYYNGLKIMIQTLQKVIENGQFDKLICDINFQNNSF